MLAGAIKENESYEPPESAMVQFPFVFWLIGQMNTDRQADHSRRAYILCAYAEHSRFTHGTYVALKETKGGDGMPSQTPEISRYAAPCLMMG